VLPQHQCTTTTVAAITNTTTSITSAAKIKKGNSRNNQLETIVFRINMDPVKSATLQIMSL